MQNKAAPVSQIHLFHLFLLRSNHRYSLIGFGFNLGGSLPQEKQQSQQPHPMDTDAIETTSANIDGLGTRLQRLEFVLAGTCEDPSTELSNVAGTGGEASIRPRIATLQRDLARLQQKSRTVAEILSIHAQFPDVFGTTTARVSASTLLTEEKATTVLMSAPEYQAAASQLVAINDAPIPDPALSASLVELMPRLQRAQAVQDEYMRKIAELRLRTAKVLEHWFLVGVEGVNECFAEWDERTFEMDKVLSQRIAATNDF
ncbi:hypothetical protein FN846DRAFT_963726 [Sphaerosporella brunnea]|uniref:Nuclear distribution protein n=1 Tax=Sphaerosporella brunnea TaxID=1250544 RepID=A0A5J5ELV7_9PEZI|nr:hypothetical protein FN846DRAFT_963726 [Sphaerosporella brunnea]